jgi:tetratricopeptide (TPR) repeat protein
VKPRGRTLLLIAALVALLLWGFDQLRRMDGRLAARSATSTRALAHYLVGDYAEAARWYRDDLRRWAAAVPEDAVNSWTILAAGDLDRAERQAATELVRSPDHPEVLLTLAEIALARGALGDATRLASRVLELRRDDYDALLLTAVARGRSGAPHPAVDALKRALRYDHAERRGTVYLAVLEATGELDDRPAAARPHCLLAHLHRYLRIYDPAQAGPAARYAAAAIEAGDRPDDAEVTLAVVERKPSRALAAFQRAVALNPRNTAALLGAARLHADRGEVAEEYRLTRAAAAAAPADPFVTATLHALLTRKLGDYGQALGMAEAAVAADPRNAEGWWRVGHVRSHLGQHRQALESFQRAAALAPRTAELEDNIGGALVQLGRHDEAVAAYHRSVSLDPLRPQPHYGLGALHGKARRWPDALREYEMGYALGGRDVEHVVGLCELYAETGHGARATACVTEVLTRDPDNVRAQALLEHVRALLVSPGARR